MVPMGGGVAFVDYDKDNWWDLYLNGGQNPDALYRNNGDGTFTDVTAASGNRRHGSVHDTRRGYR